MKAVLSEHQNLRLFKQKCLASVLAGGWALLLIRAETRSRNGVRGSNEACPEEALNYVWDKYLIDSANQYYQDVLKPLDPSERNMPAFFAAFGQKSSEEFIDFIMAEYPGRWTEEELKEQLAGITMPGIWEGWNGTNNEREIALSLVGSFYWGQSELGRRRFSEVLNDPIFNQFFRNKDTRNYERITNDDLQRWLVGPNELWVIPSPWEDKNEALRTLYHWNVTGEGEPLLYPIEEEPEARGGRPPGLAAPPPPGALKERAYLAERKRRVAEPFAPTAGIPQ